MAVNQFVPVATGGGALVEPIADYLIDPVTAQGNQNGIADPAKVNRQLRQGTFPTAAISQFMCDVLGIDILDDGNLTEYKTNFEVAIAAFARTNVFNLTAYIGHGRCYLSKSGSNLLLLPENGGGLVINGVLYPIPAAGLQLAPSGLTANTLYYIYAFMSGPTMTLEAATTGHSTSATTGVEIKTGDPTRTLVGMAYCDTGVVWVDSNTGGLAERLVLSWFNRILVGGGVQPTAGTITTSSPTLVDWGSHVRFLKWADESFAGSCLGVVGTTSSNTLVEQALGIDGIAAGNILGATHAQATTSVGGSVPGVSMSGTCYFPSAAEGLHYLTLAIATAGGNTVWFGNGASAISVMTRG